MSGQADQQSQRNLEKFLDPGVAARAWIDKHLVRHALGVSKTLYATAALTFHALVHETPGALIECGVYAGVHPAIFDYVCRFMGKTRGIYLFDSFEGIPRAGPNDGEGFVKLLGRQYNGKIVASGISFCPLRGVISNLKTWGSDVEKLHIVKGWFHETMPTVNVGPIAILRLDADLYESTKVCMEHLYDSVVSGGYVIVDDWEAQGVKLAVRDHIGEPTGVVRVPGTSCYYWEKT